MRMWNSATDDLTLKGGSIVKEYTIRFDTTEYDVYKRIEKFFQELMDEPQTDCGDFANRLAYERGVKHAWEVAQKVFTSTVTFYEAEDVAKQIDKDINVRSKTEPQLTPNYCGTCKHREVSCGDLPCDVCHGYSNYEPKDEPQTGCPWK